MTVTATPVRDLGAHRQLDGLRGLAILAVLATHVVFLNGGDDTYSLKGGFLGVDVFLVLSGFLIGGVLVREAGTTGSIDGASFARRRAHRLIPPLAVLVLVHTVVSIAIGDDAGEQLLQAVLALTFTANWQLSFDHHAPLGVVHLWSLALEAQFYALVALGVWALRRHLRRPVPLLVGLGVGVVAVAVWRAVALERGWLLESLYQRTDTRLDSLLLGVAALLVWRHRIVSDAVLRVAGGVGALILLAAWIVAEPSSEWLYRGGFSVLGLAAAAVVAAAATGLGPVARLADVSTLRWVGGLSYSLYLWHLPIYVWTRRTLQDSVPLWVLLLIAVPASFAAAMLSFRLFEARAIARRRQPAPA